MSYHGLVYWNELNTWEAGKAMAYYGPIMGWTFDEFETAGTDNRRPYYIAKKNDNPVAGIFTMYSPDFDGIGEHWFTYLAVDDLKAAMNASNEAGGKICREPFDIPNFGTMVVIQAVGGAFQAFIEPAPMPDAKS
ncbi:MAG: VOC family protein [Pseudomonadota bacterium]